MHVAGDPIPLSVYRNWLVRTRGEPLSRLYTEYWLIRREAERRGAAVSAETVAAAFQEEVDERIEKAFGGDREHWIAELAQAGRSAAGRRAERSIQLESPLLLKELAAIDRVVSDEKIAREWELRYGRGGRRFTVR
ncbi:MAG: hypothetical protein O7B99_03275, partial [Planctomycetota bacterium]|nr:hypothetical protein [Planctomycetota bacterium]